MVTPAAKREAVAHLQTTLGMSERRACAVVGADRASMRYRSCRADDGDLRSRLRELAQQRRRFGYRRLHILLRRDGITINRKKTQRLYREEGLTVRRRKGRRRAVGARAPAPVLALPNQRWSLDFVHDQLVTGRRFRVLNIVDDVTRECLAAVIDTSISGRRVVRELGHLIARRGAPKMIVSDNGTELTSNAVWPGAVMSGSSGIILHPADQRRTGSSRALMVACATNCSMRRCSSRSVRRARSLPAGSTIITPSGRTPRSATPPRRRSPPNSKSNGRG
jgi:putative transposase